MSDEELQATACDYLWLAKHSPQASTARLTEIIVETERRGKPEIISRARKPGVPDVRGKSHFRRR
jgi:hypothetical protein